MTFYSQYRVALYFRGWISSNDRKIIVLGFVRTDADYSVNVSVGEEFMWGSVENELPVRTQNKEKAVSDTSLATLTTSFISTT